MKHIRRINESNRFEEGQRVYMVIDDYYPEESIVGYDEVGYTALISGIVTNPNRDYISVEWDTNETGSGAPYKDSLYTTKEEAIESWRKEQEAIIQRTYDALLKYGIEK